MENSALRLITGLGNAEVIPNLTRFINAESKPNIMSSESEELNRVIVLTMARAIHVTGKINSLLLLIVSRKCFSWKGRVDSKM